MGVTSCEFCGHTDSPTIKLIKAAVIRLLLIAIFIISAMMIGCSPRITKGQVTDKHFEPAHGKMEFNAGLEMLQYVRVPERWTINISREIDGEIVTRTIEVNEATYERYEIGDWADFSK